MMKRVVAVLGWLLLCAGSLPASAQVATEPLAPAGQAAFDAGVAAYKQQQWKAALDHFKTAEYEWGKYPSVAPQIAFNLGMTHGAAGNELAAAAWLQAYLIRTPEAQNKVSVEAAIQRLESDASAKIERLFIEAEESAQLFGGDDSRNALASLSMERAAAGDFDGAVRIGKLRSDDGVITAHAMDFIRALYAASLLDSGDDTAAQMLLWQLQTDAAARNGALNAVLDEDFDRLASRLIHSYRDFAAAQAAIAKIHDPQARERAARRLADSGLSPGVAASLPENPAPNETCAMYLANEIGSDDHLSTLVEDLRSTAGTDAVEIPARLGALAAIRAGYLRSIRGLRLGSCPALTSYAVEYAKGLGGLK